ncbi:MAG: hypothetical protein AAF529_11950, partial [Pseudomonadota bacterium]
MTLSNRGLTRSLLGAALLIAALPAIGDTPTLSATPPAEDFVGETFCFDAELTNVGSTGYGPYYQVITKPDYLLDSATFLGTTLTPINVGTFPAAPGNQLTDPISGDPVTGPDGGELYVVRYPIGSVVTGQPSLDMNLCIDVDANATINVLETDAVELVPVYEFGDTPTGANGPTTGTRADYDFTPRVILYSIDDITAEMERPPGPAWEWDINVFADIASDRNVAPIDFATVSPIVLPANVQFVGPVTFTGTGNTCTATTPGPGPGGSVSLSCVDGDGTIGVNPDISVSFPVYIVDTLDETTCGTAGAINTAKHVTIQKGVSGTNIPGSTLTFTIQFEVSEFVAGIDDLEITDVLPDGLTYVNAPTVTYGGGPVAIVPTVSNDTPGVGQTTVVYDVTGVTGALTPATSGFITYTATIDQLYAAAPFAGEPIRARDTLANNVTGEYDITSGAANCSDDSSASITIADVVSSKSIIGATTVQPGDLVTWRLRLDIPSGDVQGIRFNDYFPLPVFDVDDPTIGVDTMVPLTGNPSISLGPNDTVGTQPTAVSVDGAENRLTIDWPDLISTTAETIEVDVTIEVSSEPFADGLELSNLFQAITNNSPADAASGLNVAQITLQEPHLAITKTATSAATGLEAGDTVTFDIVVTNDGSAEAYDVTVTDTLPAELTSCSLGAVTGGAGAGDVFGAGYTFTSFTGTTLTALDPGDSVTLPITCDVAATAENNSSYDNTAGVVWAAQPSATLFPQEAATASVATRQAQTFKEIVTTSEAHTDDTTADTNGDRRPVVTGEIIRYRMWGYLPQGVTAGAELRDLLPTGLEYVAGSETLLGLVSDSGTALTPTTLACGGGGTAGRVGNETTDLSTLALDCIVTPSSGGSGTGDDPFFDLGDIDNTEDDANEELVVLEMNARVIGDVAAGTALDNRFRINTDNGNATSGRVYAEQTNPDLTVSKSVSPATADADDTVEYIIQIEHSTSTGDEVTAFDIEFTDVIQAGLTYVPGITGPQAPASETCNAALVASDETDPSGAGITFSIDELPAGEVCEFRYSATTNPGVTPGQTITNTVTSDYTSLPGTGTDPNGTGSAPGTEASYQSQDDATLTIDTVDIDKEIVTTSLTDTSDATADSAGDPRPLAIGETITYRLEMRLPEGGAPDYEVTDLLPAGLSYVANSSRIAFVFDGAGTISATPAITCTSGTLNQTGDETSIAGITPSCGLEPSGGPFGSGTDPFWDLGDLMNTDMDGDDEFVVIEFYALVVNETGNQDGTALTNSYELSINSVTTTSSSVFAEVAEPQLTLTAAVTPDPVDNRLDTTPATAWDITLANTGNATAYQVDSDGGGGLEFVLPTGVEDISALTITVVGDVFQNGTATPIVLGDISLSTTNNTNDTLTLSGPLQLAPGASLLIEFNAELLASVEPGDTLNVTEEVVYAGQSTGNSGSGVRDDANQASGTGNSPITSTTNLNDYRTEASLTVNTTAENPSLTVTKTIAAGPTNNGDGTFTLTYAIALTNSGDVNLENVAIADDLDAVFGSGNYSVDDVTVTSDSTTLTENLAFTGNGANTGLLIPGSSTLPFGESGSISLELTVTPGAALGPLTNTAVGTSDSDRSATAANDNGTVDVTFDEGAEIGLAKALQSGPVNNNDGTYTLSYRFTVENSGAIVLDNLQITDTLDTTFAGATFSVDSITSTDFTVDAGYDGLAAGTPTLLTGADSLAAGASGTVDLAITVTPGMNLGPYNNSASISADPPSDNTVNDTSTTGTDPDTNGNNDPTDDGAPTAVTFAESPQIGTAKAVNGAVTNNNDGTYALTYRVTLENFGDVPLTGVQATDNLTTTFGVSYVVDNVTSSDFAVNFPGFDGSTDFDLLAGTDGLAVGASGTVDVTVTVTPGTSLGPYNNVATGSGTSPGGTLTTDASHNGTDPDGNGNNDPSDDNTTTPVTFTEAPEIGLAKAVNGAITNNGDGTFSLTYRLVVENSGDVPLTSVQVTDALNTTFGGATAFSVNGLTSTDFTVNFPGYNGSTDTNLLAGTDSLAAGASGSVDLQITVTPGTLLGPYNNTATASGTSSGGMVVNDISDTGTDPDGNGNNDPGDDADPTPVTFVENPEIGLAKAVQGVTANNNDGTYTFTYRFTLENSGDSPLSAVQITDNLNTTFTGASYSVDAVTSGDFTVNFPGFDGNTDQELLAAGNTLATGNTGTVDVTLTVTPGTNLGPYNNTATATATAPGGGTTNDVSDSGLDPDGNGNNDPSDDADATPITFTEDPEIGLAKDIAAGPVNNLDGTYTLTYRLFVENSGDVPVTGLQIADDLNTVFGAATSFSVDNLTSADLTVNFPGFNGTTNTNLLAGTDALAVGADGTLDLVITVTPGATLGPYDNTALASATSAGGTPINDTSQTGSDPDANSNGDPADDSTPTTLTFVEGPAITVAKAVLSAPANNNDGTYTLSYRLTVTNAGDTPLNSLQVTDDIEAAFTSVSGFSVDNVTSPTLTVNFPGFDGTTAGDINLLTGVDSLATAASADIDLTLTITPGAALGPHVNAAGAAGTSPGTTVVTDTGNAPNVSFAEAPEIGIAKGVTSGPTNNGDGSYGLTYTLVVENSGDVPLANVQVSDVLSTTFALASGFTVDSATSTVLTVNPGYDGAADSNLLSGADTLATGQSETIVLALTITPGTTLGPYNNTAVASATSPSNAPVADNSTDGNDPDANGNGNPGDDATPTQTTFAEDPEIGLAKALTGAPTNNADGTYTLSYLFTIANSGDVVVNNLQVTDDLNTAFAAANTYSLDSISSGDFAANADFNGSTDQNLLSGSDSLTAGASGTINLTITVTPGASLGPYNNSANVAATSPGGTPLTDTSDDGTNPDGNGNGDPTDDSDTTPILFTEAPEIGIAKEVTTPLNNGDGTYTLTYRLRIENSGDVVANGVQVIDDLGSTFAGASGFVIDNLSSGDFTVNFPGFNGTADQNLLTGTDNLTAGATGTVELTLTVTPGANLGPYDNSAVVNATSPTGAALTDTSQNGVDPDADSDGDPSNDSQATQITFAEAPQIGIAKTITAGPVNNADGTHTLTYQLLLANTGDVDLGALQVGENLTATFAGASGFTIDALTSTDFTVNGAFNGAADTNLLSGTDGLTAGSSGSVELTVSVTPGANLGPYANSATISGTSPAGADVTDVSDDATTVDENGNGDPGDDSDATLVTFAESPVLGVAKALTLGPVNNGDGTYSVSYRITVENSGDVNLENLNVTEDLATVFADAAGFTVTTLTS